MNKNRVMTLLTLTARGTAAIALLNKYITITATSKNLTQGTEALCFKWRLGNIYYTKTGNGKPLLLVHDLNFASSGYEWNLLVDKLSRTYTVYTIDLLGCGRSEKPNLTYTNYLYVQLLCDFIKSEIGHRTSMIASGESSSIAVMACNNSPDLFNQIMLINPDSLLNCSLIPGKNAKIYKFILDFPVIGTFFYHIASSRTMLEEAFTKKYFFNPYLAKPLMIDHYYEAAHLGDYPKATFSSLECKYTKSNIINSLKNIDNSIIIVGGSEEPCMEEIIAEYKNYNSAIESQLIPKTKHLPQLECPEKLLDAIYTYFS